MAIEAAREAGVLLQKNFHNIHSVAEKSNRRDIITELDVKAEKVILDKIQ